ncbi:adipocyte plasma membrane-associated protein-like [Actinia tenebrosa]|uniref:Adipocyte plasma membrane-associated protein-like n=1 Tax=Actinia tenebrosa TaxID=6105 RepID=A0A6P8IXU7_ACTTE|nr:adipocyte plasma membrane-associated protein-like [Actinia tenebrosa]
MAKDKIADNQTDKKSKEVNHEANGRSCMGICTVVLLVIVGLFAATVLLVPSPIDPKPFSLPEPLPKLEGPLEQNEELRKTERLYKGQIAGPESIAIDSEGTVYTGLADGRIVKFVDGKIVDVARTGKPPCDLPELESTCGRPLGMRFNRYGTKLIVADAYYGLLEVDVLSGSTSTLVPPTPGVHGDPFKFFNDLDIDRKGTIYFTDSSTKWQRKDNRFAILEGDATGRLMAYHKTGELEVLVSGLHFANGVQITTEGDAVLVAETALSRILKYYIKGPDEGKTEVFMDNLPGLPDNIRQSSNGGYWIGFSGVRKAPFSMLDMLAPKPLLRKIIAKLIPQEWIIKLVPKYGLILEVSDAGRILRSFHDPGGQVVSSASEVHEENGVLYIGSYFDTFLGKLKL